MLRDHIGARSMRVDKKRSDSIISILRDFVKSYWGKAVSTDDFQAVVEKKTGRDFDWFFDQWIRRSEIPHIEWSYSTQKVDDGMILSVHMVRRGGDGEGFILPIPIHVTLDNGRSGTLLFTLKEREKTFEQELPTKPDKLVFNPNHAVMITNKRK